MAGARLHPRLLSCGRGRRVERYPHGRDRKERGMKCWCFNQEQLERALRAWLEEKIARGDVHVSDLFGRDIRAFLQSEQARTHKLILDGMWERNDPARVVATP